MRILSVVITLSFIFNPLAWAGPAPQKATEPSIESTPSIDMSAKSECYMNWHKRFSYLTLAMVVGAVATHDEGKAATDSHRTFGTVAALSYLTSSYFAFAAPKIEGKEEKASQKIHRWLGYAAIPLMILLPLSGIDASKDYDDGRKPDGIGKSKGALTGLTVGTLAASTALAYFEF